MIISFLFGVICGGLSSAAINCMWRHRRRKQTEAQRRHLAEIDECVAPPIPLSSSEVDKRWA